MVLVVAIGVNWIRLSTEYSLLSQVLADEMALSEETQADSLELAETIADEGIVLLKNDDDALPISTDTKLNVFGWGSTQPVYGGSGSGDVDESTATSTNYGNFSYTNSDEINGGTGEVKFLNYVESIYVGYKFYETAAVLTKGLSFSADPTLLSNTDDANTVIALREAAHENFYAQANSNALELNNGAAATWVMMFYVADAVLAVILIAAAIVTFLSYKKVLAEAE